MKNFTLIAGGSGFVGQNLAARLMGEGRTVRIYDKALPRIGSGHCGDIKDLELLTEAMRGAEIVYHLASNPDISKSSLDPTVDFYEGTLLTQNILEAMRLTGVRKLVYFSGSGVYGEDATVEFTEDHGPLEPISTYGASKLACEALICSYCHMFGMSARVFRPANIVGPGQTHGVGLDFMRRIKFDPTSLRVLGDGQQSKSYIHIDDVLDAVSLIEKTRFDGFRVYNIGTGDHITVKEIATIASRIAGASNCELKFTGGDRGWNGDVPVIRLNCDRLKELGWAPKMGSVQAMTAALESMVQPIYCSSDNS